MATLRINGDIISDDLNWVYDWYGYECTCPKMVRDAVDALQPGETLNVLINSPGGDVFAGLEIYSILRSLPCVKITVQSIAASAASIIACSGHCEMEPVALMMVHNVSCNASGDYRVMEKTGDTLKKINDALASAYMLKTGLSKDSILKMMDDETWLTAEQCKAYGLADTISEIGTSQYKNAIGALRVTDEMVEKAKNEFSKRDEIFHNIVDDLDDYGKV